MPPERAKELFGRMHQAAEDGSSEAKEKKFKPFEPKQVIGAPKTSWIAKVADALAEKERKQAERFAELKAKASSVEKKL